LVRPSAAVVGNPVRPTMLPKLMITPLACRIMCGTSVAKMNGAHTLTLNNRVTSTFWSVVDRCGYSAPLLIRFLDVALAQFKGAFGQSLHVVDLGEVGGDEVGRPATLGHGRAGRQSTGRIATANDDVGPAGGGLTCHHSPDTHGASGNQSGLARELGCHTSGLSSISLCTQPI
jgi:hypothetical protein